VLDGHYRNSYIAFERNHLADCSTCHSKRYCWTAGLAIKFRINKGKISVLEFHWTKFVTSLQFVAFGESSVQPLHVALNLSSGLSNIEQSVLCETSVWLYCAPKPKRWRIPANDVFWHKHQVCTSPCVKWILAL